jgi:TP901 family phage tail tape measure protein
MSDQANTSINIEGNALVMLGQLKAEFEAMRKQVTSLQTDVDKSFEKVVDSGRKVQQALSVQVLDVLGRTSDIMAQPFRSGADAVYEYDASLQELSSITDIVGPDLENLGGMARQMASEFGGTPQGHLDSYTKLLSALTPEIAKNETALDSFARTSAMLANTMNGDSVGAVRALETSMNQFGVNLDDPIAAAEAARTMMNDVAAAAKVGKVEVPGLADAITRSGSEAASAGVGFRSYVSALEVAGKFFGSSERLGTAMRGVLSTIGSGALPKDTLEQLKAAGVDMGIVTNQSLTLRQRLTELKKIEGDGGLMEKVFGAGETTAGRGLLQNLELLDRYESQIGEMPTALEDMNDRVMGGFRKQKELLDNFFSDIKLGFFSTFGASVPYLDLVGTGLMGIISVAPGIMALQQAMTMLSESTKLQAMWTGITTGLTTAWTTVTGALNAVMMANPAIAITAGIIALVGAVVWAWNTFDGFRGAVLGLWEAFKVVFSNIFDFFGRMFSPVLEAIALASEGKWKEAALAAGKAVFNVATMPIQALGAVASGDITKGSRTAFNSAYNAEQTTPDPSLPGGEKKKGTGAYVDTPMVPSPMVPKTTDGGNGSSSGGAGRIVTVHINNLVEKVENRIAGGNVDMSLIRDEVRKALIAAVRDFELSA